MVIVLAVSTMSVAIYILAQAENKNLPNGGDAGGNNTTAAFDDNRGIAGSTAPPNKDNKPPASDEKALLYEFMAKKDELLKNCAWNEIDSLIGKYEPGFSAEKDKFNLIKHDLLHKKSEAENGYKRWLDSAEKNIKDNKLLESARDIARAASLYKSADERLTLLVNEIKNKLVSDMVEIPESVVNGKTVAKFRLARNEVTNYQYCCFVILAKHPPPPYWQGTEFPDKLNDLPVFLVTHSDAESFAKWLGKRLPTEEEWQAACSFGGPRKYPWGDEFAAGGESHNAVSMEYSIYMSTFWKEPIFPRPVGSMKGGASRLGINDLAGNVWEWTSTKVTDGGAEFYVLKGGSYLTYKEAIECSYRLLELPHLRHYDVGFRVAE